MAEVRQREYQIISERGANSTDTQSRETITLAAEIINSAVHNHGHGIHRDGPFITSVYIPINEY